jgi:hypothetical protein
MPARKMRTSRAPRLGHASPSPIEQRWKKGESQDWGTTRHWREQSQEVILIKRRVDANLFLIEERGVQGFARNADMLKDVQHGRAFLQIEVQKVALEAGRAIVAQDRVQFHRYAHAQVLST